MVKEFMIRNPQDEDVEQIEGLNFVLKLLYLYHDDFNKKNMFCAVNGEGEIIAVAHLMEHDTFHAVRSDDNENFIRYLTFELAFEADMEEDRVKDALTEALLRRSREIKSEYPDKRIVMAQYIDTDNLQDLSYLLARGFTIHDTIVVFKFDLSRDIPSYPLPEGVRVLPYALDHNEALEQYHQAELASFDGVAWSMNLLRWMQGAQEMVNYCAFSDSQFIGNTSTWRITEERSATENVFVIPDWQKKGVARGLLCTALNALKEQGKTIATLGTHGSNRKAIRLYTEIGYELYGFRLTIGYEID